MTPQDTAMTILQHGIPIFWIQPDGTVFWNDGKKQKQCKTNKDLALAFAEALKVFINHKQQ